GQPAGVHVMRANRDDSSRPPGGGQANEETNAVLHECEPQTRPHTRVGATDEPFLFTELLAKRLDDAYAREHLLHRGLGGAVERLRRPGLTAKAPAIDPHEDEEDG